MNHIVLTTSYGCQLHEIPRALAEIIDDKFIDQSYSLHQLIFDWRLIEMTTRDSYQHTTLIAQHAESVRRFVTVSVIGVFVEAQKFDSQIYYFPCVDLDIDLRDRISLYLDKCVDLLGL